MSECTYYWQDTEDAGRVKITFSGVKTIQPAPHGPPFSLDEIESAKDIVKGLEQK